MNQKRTVRLREKWPYLGVAAIVIAVLCVLYRDLDIRMPVVYNGGDEFGVFYIIKTIKETGWYLVNPRVGGVTGGDLFDYVYSDSLSFFMVKVIGLFVSNIYMVGNLFYFGNYILAACSSLYVCRKLKIRNEVSIAVSVLYAFSTYIQCRYGHLWLTPYFLLPLACLVAIWICEGTVTDGQEKFWKSKQFYLAAIFSFLCAFTGFYYAFFTCVIYAAAIVIRWINIGFKKLRKELYSVILIGTTIFGVALNALPNLFYWMQNGSNSQSELAIRGIGDAETYGLKLIQLILPRINHRISVVNNFVLKYFQNYPLVNENYMSTLGLVATFGLLLSFIWLFGRYAGRRKTCAYLILALFLVGTIGGVGSLFSLLIKTPMRCYNRLSIMILFLCLVCVAFALEDVRAKMKRALFVSLLVAMMLLGILDQTIDYTVPPEQHANFTSTQNFIRQIEAEVEEGCLIFELPYVDWPTGGAYRMLAGYLESEKLRWSFGTMQGRPEALWQAQVAASDVDTMLNTLSESGYGGIYLDMPIYTQKIGDPTAAETLCAELTKKLGVSPMVSENGELYFWTMEDF